jgi:hypothetical protein
VDVPESFKVLDTAISMLVRRLSEIIYYAVSEYAKTHQKYNFTFRIAFVRSASPPCRASLSPVRLRIMDLKSSICLTRQDASSEVRLGRFSEAIT